MAGIYASTTLLCLLAGMAAIGLRSYGMLIAFLVLEIIDFLFHAVATIVEFAMGATPAFSTNTLITKGVSAAAFAS